jgi:hypothetical protein
VFVLIAVLVTVGAFGQPNLRLTHYLQGRGSLGQDIGLGIFSYLGSIELTLVIAALIGLALFRGLRLLAVLPMAVILVASGLELLGKLVVPSVAPGKALQRFPDILPSARRSLMVSCSISRSAGNCSAATVPASARCWCW